MNSDLMYKDSSAPVQPEQLMREFSCLLSLFEEQKPKIVVEIGSYKGGTLYQWLKRVPVGSLVIAIDVVGGPWGAVDAKKFVWQWPSWVPGKVIFRHIPLLSQTSEAKEALAGILGDEEIDFLFLDGDHRYEVVKNDFEYYGRLVRSGGIIALHDIFKTNEESGVYQLWREINEAGYTTQELCSFPDQTDMGIGVIRI